MLRFCVPSLIDDCGHPTGLPVELGMVAYALVVGHQRATMDARFTVQPLSQVTTIILGNSGNFQPCLFCNSGHELHLAVRVRLDAFIEVHDKTPLLNLR